MKGLDEEVRRDLLFHATLLYHRYNTLLDGLISMTLHILAGTLPSAVHAVAVAILFFR